MTEARPAHRRLADIRGVLVDMDGTLVDSDAAVERQWRAWARSHDVDPEAVIAVCHGSTGPDTMRRFRPDLSQETIAREGEEYLRRESEDLDGVVAAPGAMEFIEVVRELGLPWLVVTNADRRLAMARLGAAGIDPPGVVAVDDVAAGKPDPAGYLLGARRIGVEIGRCLVVEDSAAGVAAGRAAGALVAGVRGIEADLDAGDLSGLTAHLRARSLGGAPLDSHAPESDPAEDAGP